MKRLLALIKRCGGTSQRELQSTFRRVKMLLSCWWKAQAPGAGERLLVKVSVPPALAAVLRGAQAAVELSSVSHLRTSRRGRIIRA